MKFKNLCSEIETQLVLTGCYNLLQKLKGWFYAQSWLSGVTAWNGRN